MANEDDVPNGYVLSESAMYAFKIQDVFPDVVSFSAAIPSHLRHLFLIPINVTMASSRTASRLAVPTGDTEEADLFGTKTFTYNDNEPTIPSSEPGSIFEIDGADAMTHHNEDFIDENLQSPTETSYMEDIDISQYFDYPYRTEESPVRHSSVIPKVLILKLALRSESIITKTPSKVKDRASSCSVSLTSYDKKTKVFTFNANCGNGNHIVRASVKDLENVSLTCDCKFWQYGGPEFHAEQNAFMFGNPNGTASPPDIRDPDRQFWLCKHTYAVLKRIDSFIADEIEENQTSEEDEILIKIDEDWDKMQEVTEVPLDDSDDLEVDWEVSEIPDGDEEDVYEIDLDDSEEEPETESKAKPEPEEEPEEEPEDVYEIDLEEPEEEPDEEPEDVYEIDFDESPEKSKDDEYEIDFDESEKELDKEKK